MNDGGVRNEVQLKRQMGDRDGEEMDTEVLVEDEQVPGFGHLGPSIFLKDALGRARAWVGPRKHRAQAADVCGLCEFWFRAVSMTR